MDNRRRIPIAGAFTKDGVRGRLYCQTATPFWQLLRRVAEDGRLLLFRALTLVAAYATGTPTTLAAILLDHAAQTFGRAVQKLVAFVRCCAAAGLRLSSGFDRTAQRHRLDGTFRRAFR